MKDMFWSKERRDQKQNEIHGEDGYINFLHVGWNLEDYINDGNFAYMQELLSFAIVLNEDYKNMYEHTTKTTPNNQKDD